ncbi:MAG: cyclic nucleotide-binding domain-containing protein [Mariprofundales bacterium]
MSNKTQQEMKQCMQAGNAMMQSQRIDDAANLFAKAAIGYVEQGHIDKGMKALSLYRECCNDSRNLAYQLLHLCRQHGTAPQSLLRILSGQEHIESILLNIPAFSELDSNDCACIMNLTNQKRFSAGENVLTMGDVANSLFFILRGEVNVLAPYKGIMQQVAVIKSGEMFGELAYFIGCKRTASVIAAEDSTLLELSYKAMDTLLNDLPALKHSMHNDYMQRLQNDRLLMVPLFSEWEEDEVLKLADQSDTRMLPAGDLLFEEGSHILGVYLICQGNIVISVGHGKREHTVAILSEGDLFGNMSHDAVIQSTTARAATDCTIMMMPVDDMQNALYRSTVFRNKLEGGSGI